MTTNQINWWKYVEEKRHNIAVEQETQRYNKIVNAQNDLVIAENKRHNLEQELVGLKQASAALTSAAAAMSQANTRARELIEAERVNSATIARQDQLAQAQIREYASVANLNSAKETLTYVQAESEAAKAGLYTVQQQVEQQRVDLIQAQTWNTWAGTVREGIGAVDSLVGWFKPSGIASLK